MHISREKIRKHRWLWLFLFVGLPLTIFGGLWFGFSPDVPDHAVRVERDGSGNFVDRLLGGKEEPAAGATFEAQFGSLNAQNNMTSSSSVGSGNPSFFADGHIAILNRSDHMLMKRVGGLVVEQLKQRPWLQRIDYYPLGESMPRGERAPDVFVTLDLGSLDESGLLIKHKLKADIEVTASDNLARSNHTYIDNLTPPQITFRWNGTLQHDSTTAGLQSSGAKYKLAAQDIAKQIADALVKQFDNWREKYSPLPAIPAEFYPAYQSAPTPPALQKRNAELLFTGHGLMNRNQTVWEFQSDKKPSEVLQVINEELTADGWKAPDFNPHELTPHLRAKRNGVVLEVFPARGAGHDITIQGHNDEDQATKPATFYATYLDRMSQDEILVACRKLLESEPPVTKLVAFQRYWYGDRDLQQRILKYLQAKSASSPEALVALTNLLHRDKQDEEARRTLLAAYALTETLPSPDKYKGRLEQLAKEMKIEEFPPKTIDLDLLRKYGVRELVPGMRIAEIELGLDEPVMFFSQSPDGSTHLYSFRVVSGTNDQFELAFVNSELGGCSREWGRNGSVREGEWSSQRRSLDESEHTLRFFVRKLPNERRFVAAVDVVDAKKSLASPPYRE